MPAKDFSSRQRKYWALWGECKRQLARAGFDSAEIEAIRHASHTRALAGRDPSSRDIIRSPRDLTAVLAEFQAIADPGDFDSQLAAIKQQDPRERLLFAIRRLGLPDPYLDAIARDQFKLTPWSSLSLQDLTKLRYTATRAAQRRKKKDQQP